MAKKCIDVKGNAYSDKQKERKCLFWQTIFRFLENTFVVKLFVLQHKSNLEEVMRHIVTLFWFMFIAV